MKKTDNKKEAPAKPIAEDFLVRLGDQIRDAIKAGLLPPDTAKVSASLKVEKNAMRYWEVKAVQKPPEPIVGQGKLFTEKFLPLDEAKKLASQLCPPGMSVSLTDGKTGAGVEIKRIPANGDSGKKAA